MSANGHQRPLAVGVDIGGTFTDFVVLDESRGEVRTKKVLTTQDAPHEGVIAGLQELIAEGLLEPAAVGLISHATTLATNAIIQRSGAKVGFITTRGFHDSIFIGREHRYDMQDLLIDLPQPLVEPDDVVEVRERTLADGSILEKLDEDELETVARGLLERGAESLAVGFLHSYRNAANERRAAAVLRERLGVRFVSTSAEISAVIREFARFTTVICNAYVQPIVDSYIENLERRLRELGFDAPLVIMLSNGGLAVPADARAYPVRLVESGPAAGVIAAARLAGRLQFKSALTFDMGGTTAKGSIVHDGFVEIEYESEVARLDRFKAGSGLPLVVPTVDLIEIGAGGGSIARVDAVGRLQVGPESAESDPGPAAYGRGGTSATVTDADLLLGYLDPASFAGGRFTLDVAAARTALHELGARLGVGERDAAYGIHTTVNQNMASAFRIHAVERGVDIRECSLVAFGGAGAIHACAVAEILGARTVAVPFNASVFSALGLTETMPSFSAMRTAQSALRTADYARLNALFAELEQQCREKVDLANARGAELAVHRSFEMRYAGQMRQIHVRVPGGALSPESEPVIADAFADEYRKRFEQIVEGVPLEIVNLAVAVRTVPTAGDAAGVPSGAGEPAPARREIWFDLTGATDVPVYDWASFAPAGSLAGPALVDRKDTVVVIRPGWAAELLPDRTLLLRRG